MSRDHDAPGVGRRAREKKRRPGQRSCLCEGCGRGFSAGRWNQRYCVRPTCRRRVQRWRWSRRQELCRGTPEGKRRHRDRERLRRQRAKERRDSEQLRRQALREREWKLLLVLLAAVVTVAAGSSPRKPKESNGRRQFLVLLLLVLAAPVAEDRGLAGGGAGEEDSAGSDPKQGGSDGPEGWRQLLVLLLLVLAQDHGLAGGEERGALEGEEQLDTAESAPLRDTGESSEEGEGPATEGGRSLTSRGHAQHKFGEPFCDRPGCYGAPLIWRRWGECFCSEECRAALRRVEDRERKWLLRGIRAGVEWCGREFARRRKERNRLRERLLACRLRWMPSRSNSP